MFGGGRRPRRLLGEMERNQSADVEKAVNPFGFLSSGMFESAKIKLFHW